MKLYERNLENNGLYDLDIHGWPDDLVIAVLGVWLKYYLENDL